MLFFLVEVNKKPIICPQDVKAPHPPPQNRKLPMNMGPPL